jgi:hypothetical protein
VTLADRSTIRVRVDVDEMLETLLDPDAGHELPIGLRVQAFIEK